ncbi:hypothetical protein COHA_004787 [Chlorella ohadii]|uniref:Uncharacterized protein n=1 Tax=Chlorella ohadii TaxID=2649997 RepID=A0AAD5DPZ6_9CHLO|nr:hypothetical protein COHA_004787 [Chlorella ohadii]
MARSTQLWRASHGTDRLPTPARRPDYPPGVWQLLRAHVPPLPAGAPPPTCVVAAADRSKADQLAAATGFVAWPLLLGHKGEAGHLSSSAAGHCCLEQAAAAAVNMQVAPACAAAKAAATAVPPARPLQGADVFCFAGSLHLVDTHAALQAAHRHLRHNGLLLVLFTDRSLSSPFVLELEELLEGAVPGGLFRLLDFAAFPHTLALPARRLMDSLTSQSALHAALGSSRRRAFHAELQRLVDAHFVPQQAQQAQQLAAVGGSGAAVQVAPSADTVQGRQWVELPLLTKAYLLAKSAGPAPSHQCGCSSARAAAAPFAPEHHCLFCGRTINEE